MPVCVQMHLIPYQVFLDEEQEEGDNYSDDNDDEGEQEESSAAPEKEETSVPNRNNARIDYDGWVGIDTTDADLDDFHVQPSNNFLGFVSKYS